MCTSVLRRFSTPATEFTALCGGYWLQARYQLQDTGYSILVTLMCNIFSETVHYTSGQCPNSSCFLSVMSSLSDIQCLHLNPFYPVSEVPKPSLAQQHCQLLGRSQGSRAYQCSVRSPMPEPWEIASCSGFSGLFLPASLKLNGSLGLAAAGSEHNAAVAGPPRRLHVKDGNFSTHPSQPRNKRILLQYFGCIWSIYRN